MASIKKKQRTKGCLLSPATTVLSTNTSRPSDRTLNPLAYSQSPLTTIRHSFSITIMSSYSEIVHNKDVLSYFTTFLLELALWLVDRFAGWLVGWLVDCLVGWFRWLVSLVGSFRCLVGENGQFSVVWLVGLSVKKSVVRGRLDLWSVVLSVVL